MILKSKFTWRKPGKRPTLNITICRVPRSYWKLFAPHHYLTATLSKGAKCFGLFVEDKIAAFLGVIHRPISRGDKSKRLFCISRIATLPNYQGLGLAFVLAEFIGSCYTAHGSYFHNYPAHPGYARAHDRSKNWVLRNPAKYNLRKDPPTAKKPKAIHITAGQGGRPCSVFRYVGPRADPQLAQKIMYTPKKEPLSKLSKLMRKLKTQKVKKYKVRHK